MSPSSGETPESSLAGVGEVALRPAGDEDREFLFEVYAATRTEEVAVMLDTRRPLTPCDAAASTENPEYWRSWK